MPVTAMPFLGSASLSKFSSKVHAVVSFNDNFSVKKVAQASKWARFPQQ